MELLLWWPKQREWLPQMKLFDAYIAWIAEWLWYFEGRPTTGWGPAAASIRSNAGRVGLEISMIES